MKARPKTTQADNAPTFRVINLSSAVRSAIAQSRDAKTNNQRVIENAVSGRLPGLVKALHSLGFAVLTEKTKRYRLPFSDVTLGDLRDASDETGVPAAHLLTLCLASLSGKRQPRRGRKAGQ